MIIATAFLAVAAFAVAQPQQTEVVFELPIQDLAFYGKDMVKKVEPGKFQVWIAGDSASGTLAEFEVK